MIKPLTCSLGKCWIAVDVNGIHMDCCYPTTPLTTTTKGI